MQKNNKSYAHYGGRGITICDEWNDFLVFLADMGKRPDGKTLDRIDPNGNYEPSNCKWSTQSEQMANIRIKSTNKSGYKGVCLFNGKWHAQICRNYKVKSLGFFDDPAIASEAYQKAVREYEYAH